MSVQQHIHGKIGDAIYQCKKRLFKALALGADLELAINDFIKDLTRELAEIVKGEGR